VSRWARLVLAALLYAVVALVALVVVLRAFNIDYGPLLYLITITPYMLPLAVVALIVAVVAKMWPAVIISGVVLALLSSWWLPPFFGSTAGSGAAAPITVVTSNLEFGGAQASAVVALVSSQRADVLAVQELTHSELTRLDEAGISRLLPYRVVKPDEGPAGTGLWSKYPLTALPPASGTTFASVFANVDLPWGSARLASIHPAAPQPTSNTAWRADNQILVGILRAVSGPVMVLGDFNATRDHRSIRELESAGFEDASTIAGAGLVRTWPVGQAYFLPFPTPPIAGIDHVLTRDWLATATHVDTVTIPGTDHRALVASYS